MRNKLKILITTFFICSSVSYAENASVGIIDSLREDGYITVLFDKLPDRELYYIYANERIIGNISSLKEIPDVTGKKRYLCRYSLLNDDYRGIVRPGLDIVIMDSNKEIDKSRQPNPEIGKVSYKTEIISNIDRREMVLIPAGKFIMGCASCDEDEYPEHAEFIGDFYIDKYEVSNSDFKKYADIKGLKYPEYWNSQLDSKMNFTGLYFGSLPVIVTYHEAKGYAEWAGKSLPDEREWEKAAKPPITAEATGRGYLYSWGREFKEGVANTEELWSTDKTGENLKKTIAEKYGIAKLEKGYLPVDIYEKGSLSFYGVANLDGNAMEWTDSWYQKYPGNRKNSKNYGHQYKVVRGGSYFLSGPESRITDRKIGGMPDLYKDRIAGFRCIKKTAENDKK